MNYLKVILTLLALAGAPGAPTSSPRSARVPASPSVRASSPPSASAPSPENIFASPLWDDGKAEFSVYSGVTNRYGQERATDAHLVVVKEDLLRQSLVKSDAGPLPGRTVTAIKLNFIAD